MTFKWYKKQQTQGTIAFYLFTFCAAAYSTQGPCISNIVQQLLLIRTIYNRIYRVHSLKHDFLLHSLYCRCLMKPTTKGVKQMKTKRSKTQTLQALNEWAKGRGYLMKPMTSSKNPKLNVLKVEIAFINKQINTIAFIIEIARWGDGTWSLTSFTQMFETAHTRFNYIQNVLEGKE